MNRDEKLAKVKCPHCGHEQNVFLKKALYATASFCVAKQGIAEKFLKLN